MFSMIPKDLPQFSNPVSVSSLLVSHTQSSYFTHFPVSTHNVLWIPWTKLAVLAVWGSVGEWGSAEFQASMQCLASCLGLAGLTGR